VTFWLLTDTVRLAAEKAAVEALARQGGWFSLARWRLFEHRVCAEGVIQAHGCQYPVRLIYPDQFPEVPAWVEPIDPNAKWSIHQYGAGGALCLELRPDTWVPTASGADVLTSAYHLLEIENPLGPNGERSRAPSAHNIGALQSYDWSLNPLLIGAGCLARIRMTCAEDVKAFHSAYFDDTLPILIHDAVDREAHVIPSREGGTFGDIPIFVSLNDAPAAIVTRAELVDAAGFTGETAEHVVATSFALVLFVGALVVSAFHVVNENQPIHRKVVAIPDNHGQRSGRAFEASKKRVAVIGAGSVGSKMAEALVRSGLRRVTLIDGDVMLPANLERHALDWRDVGFRKANALKRRLLQIVPGLEIDVITDNLNWQRSARTHAWQVDSIADCDVIVDATGDVPSGLLLGAIAAANKRAFVSVEVFEGGIGALVASCLPNRDPPYIIARAAFLSWCEAQGVAAAKSSGRPYEAIGDQGPPLVADDAAVTMAAGHGARVVLDILDGRPVGAEAAWLLVGFQKAWLFNGHGHTIRMSVGSPTLPSVQPEDAEAQAFALDLVKEALDASAASI